MTSSDVELMTSPVSEPVDATQAPSMYNLSRTSMEAS